MLNTLLLAPTLAAALAATADETYSLRFAPAEGATTSHAYEVSQEIEGGDLAVKMNGGDVPAQFLPKLSFTMRTASKTELSETFLAAPDGVKGPWRKRLIDAGTETFEMNMAYADEEMNFGSDGQCEAEGEAVLIGLDEDGDTVARWADGDSELDKGLLEGMRPGLQLGGLLPADPVAVDARWEADAAGLMDALSPGGKLPMSYTSSEGEAPEPGDVELAGTLELRLADVREVDGAVLCTISVEGDVVETVIRETDLAEVPVADGEATETTTTNYTVEGEMVWNATLNALHSAELEGTGEGEQEILKNDGEPGPAYSSTTQHKATLVIKVS